MINVRKLFVLLLAAGCQGTQLPDCVIVTLANGSTASICQTDGGFPTVTPIDASCATGDMAAVDAGIPSDLTAQPDLSSYAVPARVVRGMFIGDSLTFGPNQSTPNDATYRAEFYSNMTAAGWQIQLVGSMASGDSTLPMSEWANEGHPGWRTVDFLYLPNGGFNSQLTLYVQAQLPLDFAAIMDGFNDCYAGGSYTGRYEPDSLPERIVEEARNVLAHAPGAVVFIASVSPTPSRYYPDARACIDATNARLPSLIDYERSQWRSIQWCDLGLVDADVCGTSSGGWPGATDSDCVHLNSIGKVHAGDAWAACVKAHVH